MSSREQGKIDNRTATLLCPTSPGGHSEEGVLPEAEAGLGGRLEMHPGSATVRKELLGMGPEAERPGAFLHLPWVPLISQISRELAESLSSLKRRASGGSESEGAESEGPVVGAHFVLGEGDHPLFPSPTPTRGGGMNVTKCGRTAPCWPLLSHGYLVRALCQSRLFSRPWPPAHGPRWGPPMISCHQQSEPHRL